MPVTEVPLGTPLPRFGISRLCCGQGKDLPGWHPVLSESKAWGTFFVINMLIFIFFIVKILPQKGQLKSSDSSRKKAASNRKRPFTTCFHLIYWTAQRDGFILPSTFAQQRHPKAPQSHFLPMLGISKTKIRYFINKISILITNNPFYPWKKNSAQHFIQHPAHGQKGMVWQSKRWLSKATEYFVFRPRRRRRKP